MYDTKIEELWYQNHKIWEHEEFIFMKVNCYRPQIDSHKYKMFYIIAIGTTGKRIVDVHKMKDKQICALFLKRGIHKMSIHKRRQ